MRGLKVGDTVVRRSHDGDVVFKIVALSSKTALLKGLHLRIMADAPLEDLVKTNIILENIPKARKKRKERGSSSESIAL